MKIINKNGQIEDFIISKISTKIQKIIENKNLNRINEDELLNKIVEGLCENVKSNEIDNHIALVCANRICDDPQFDVLAVNLCINRLHKNTSNNFMNVTNILYNNVDRFNQSHPLVTKEYYDFVKKNEQIIQNALIYERDFDFDYFGLKTLEKAYLTKIMSNVNSNQEKFIDTTFSKLNEKNDNTDNKQNNHQHSEYHTATLSNEKNNMTKLGYIVERPQHLFMKIALGLNIGNIEFAIKTYEYMSTKHFIFGSPTLFNTASNLQQLSSCYLLNMGDSITCIFDTIKNMAEISKSAGGIGVNLSNIRPKGSLIRKTNGNSDGIIPLCKVLNEVAKYVNQSGRRKGSIAAYLEPWHADVVEFCELRKNTGIDEHRARDLFLALWIPDLFMKRVQEKKMWSLMCPDECPGLTTTFGDEFEKLYTKYENEHKYKKQIDASYLFNHILSAQIETGIPYMLFKDNANRQSNQQNLGTIQCSNLCSEIIEFTNQNEIAVCNLASICLPKFIEKDKNGKLFYNYKKLLKISKIVTTNLNNVININNYPSDDAKQSNMSHRPIGIGVQGLADVFCMLGLPFDSQEARIINKKIFETIYYGSVKQSIELAKQHGHYSSFHYNGGCPMSKGLFQFHLWGLSEKDLLMNYDWEKLINEVKVYGIRNSLLTTVMPTASTSQIMGNSECIEPITTNVYTRSTVAGDFVVINKYLVNKLLSLNLWNDEIRKEIMYDNGSIQNIQEIPEHIKNIFKTAFEMNIKPVVQLSIDRGPFIDQSQSLNIFMKKPDFGKLASSHFFGWANKLKTGMYYLRTTPIINAISFGLDQEFINEIKKKRKEAGSEKPIMCSRENKFACETCSS